MSRRRTAAQLIAAVLVLNTCTVLAQAPDLSSFGNRFARATISEHGEQRRFVQGWYLDPEGNLTAQGAPLIALISRAYGVHEFQVVDGPDWISTADLYDIEATPPPPELADSDSTQMLRALLRDRFKLEVSESSREMAATALEFVKETPSSCCLVQRYIHDVPHRIDIARPGKFVVRRAAAARH